MRITKCGVSAATGGQDLRAEVVPALQAGVGEKPRHLSLLGKMDAMERERHLQDDARRGQTPLLRIASQSLGGGGSIREEGLGGWVAYRPRGRVTRKQGRDRC